MLNIWYANDLPYGPRPIWAKANMGQGPYGPGPIWARAHMGPGPLGPGPFLVGRTPHQKTHPGKKSPNCVFWLFFGNKKDAGRPYDHFPLSFAPRSLLCVRKWRIPFYHFFLIDSGYTLVRQNSRIGWTQTLYSTIVRQGVVWGLVPSDDNFCTIEQCSVPCIYTIQS